MATTLFVPLKEYIEEYWPKDLLDMPSLDVFDNIWIEPVDIQFEPGFAVHTAILFETELAVGIPGLDAVKLVFAPNGSYTAFAFEYVSSPKPVFRVVDTPIALRLDSSLLKPVKRVHATEPGKPDTFEPDTSVDHVDITLGHITLSIDVDGNINVDVDGSIDLPPCMIGDTGVVIEAQDIRLYLDATSPPPGKPAGWRGIHIGHAAVYLPGELAGTIGNLELTNAYIGNGGFSGTLSDTWTPALAAQIFGMTFSLEHVDLSFGQNSLTAAAIRGQVMIPFFNENIGVEIAPGINGVFSIKLSSAGGLYRLSKPGLLDLELESMGFDFDGDKFKVKLSGQIKPLFGGLDWPSFKVKELSIDSNGNVHLEGGWLDLRDQYSLDFHGFKIEITKLGFGKTDDGGKWIGFSGGLKLVDGLSAGASVEGLRVTWYENEAGDITDTRVTLNGVGVELEVPDVLRFKGKVSYRELPGPVHRFDGDIKLELISLDMEIDGKLVIGRDAGAGYTFFAIYMGIELPAGIPLWSTGLALYGLAGLFALQMEPDKHADEPWYGIGAGEGWFKRPEIGVADLAKWINHKDSLGLGGGVTIGTVADNGFTFSGRMLLVIVFPGPILMIEGMANLLKERAKLNEEPIFRALAVLDNRAGSFLVGLDAQYKYDTDGKLVDIRGGAEAFFSFTHADQWHLYLGKKEPRELRIRAEIFKLFEANTYFMLDSSKLATGAWVGYHKSWDFGPLSVTVEAWIEGNAVISWKPVYFHGDLWLHGKAALSVFGFGLGLSVDAIFAADVFDPFHLLAKFKVGIDLPWPLPDFDVDITLEWGPEPVPPPLPLPLKEIAVEHFKTTTSWPLPRGTMLLPNYDSDNDGFMTELADAIVSAQSTAAPPTSLPVVPVDCRPHVTFGRAVHDDALAGVNPQPVMPTANPPGWEWIGDPGKNEGPVRVRYGLKEVSLDSWNPSTNLWSQVASTASPDPKTKLFGSWAPVPQLPSGDVSPGSNPPVSNVKLWLWSKTPFDYTRHGGRAWDEWFTDRFSDYPCIPPAEEREFCCDFEKIRPGQKLKTPLHFPDHPEIAITWIDTLTLTVTVLDQPVDHLTHALCFKATGRTTTTTTTALVPNQVIIHLNEPAENVKVVVIGDGVSGINFDCDNSEKSAAITAVGLDTQGQVHGPFGPKNNEILVTGPNLTSVRISSDCGFCILRICVTIAPDPAEVAKRQEMARHLIDELARWSDKGEILQPHTTYRLKVVTTVETQGFSDGGFNKVRTQTEFSYFHTDGPPGLANLSVPIGTSNPDKFDSGLNDLNRYARQTVPATVPAPGQKPLLPRPVYCAYDVGVEFNEDYVDLMYRLEHRDLGLYLYDNNNRPVRDAEGRLIILSNNWGKTEELTLTESEKRWISVIDGSTCADIDTAVIPHDTTLTSSEEGQVLNPDTYYEARLIPLLLHEFFADFAVGTSVSGPAGLLGRWTVHDDGTNEGPSRWEIRQDGVPPSKYILQTSNIWGGTDSPADPVKPGTVLVLSNNPALAGSHPDQPANWTDYRFSVYMRVTDDDAIGVVFRHKDNNNYYRFSMDQQRKYRRLVKIFNGTHTILAEDDFVYRQDQDYMITVEAIGTSLRVYQDGKLVFDTTDDSIDQGSIGLYCWGNTGARFSDLRVDDFRKVAPVVYRFNFTTSGFANFFHHMHSFQDEIWLVELPSLTGVNAQVLQAVSLTTTPADAEHRAYDALAALAIGQTAQKNPPEVQVMRLENAGTALALLVTSPEPIDWKRTDLEVKRAQQRAPSPEIPGDIKLTDVTFGSTQPNEESVTLLLRKTTDLSGQRIEYRHLPGPIAEPADNPVLFADEFHSATGGLLFREDFGPNALDHYTIIDEGTESRPSAWAVRGGRIVQTSNIYGGSTAADVPDKPGTMAITGSQDWTDVRINVSLRSDDDDAVGIVFRYKDQNNYYRFSMDKERSYRRLIKKVDGTVTTLWQDGVAYVEGHVYNLEIDAVGDRILGYLDNALLFSVQDSSIAAGRIGLYCWANIHTQITEISVESLQPPLVLWQPPLTDLSELKIVDEGGTIGGPSHWTAAGGLLTQTSNIYSADASVHKPGTYALGGSQDWGDIQISMWIRSDNDGAIGVMFRYKDADNYYRFSMDRHLSYRRLIKKVGGTVTVLWQDSVAYTLGHSYDLTIRAVGNQIRCYLDGALLFVVYDGDLSQGRIGFYCWANTGARFSHVLVIDRTRRIGPWIIHDEGTTNAPSVWRISNGVLVQSSNIYGGSDSGAIPDKPGTYALTGESTWEDYRLIVRLKSDDNDAIGAMFRYTDGNNYYRFSMDSNRGYRRLIKKVSGTTTVLWQDTVRYRVGREYVLTLDCVGDRLVGYLDGVKLFDVEDSSLGTGRIGLYCWKNTGARFSEVRIAAMAWTSYYAFGKETVMPAGTRLRVFAGNASSAPPEEQGVIRRFIASLDESGQLRLPASGADLRVVGIKATGHTRRFLPDGAYTSIGAKVLRKADGTGFFIVVPAANPAGTSLAEGQYRLKMAYRRNNKTVDPDSQTFKQAGNSNPEYVIIDIPWD